MSFIRKSPGFISQIHLGWPFVALLGLVLLDIGVRLYFGPLLRDDAYITFKYAQNVAQGVGFVFNSGEPVLGTTTPLYTIVLAVAHYLGISPLDTGYVLGFLSDAILTFFLGWSLLKWLPGHPGVGLIATGIFAVSAPLGVFAVSGMETSFYLLLGWLSIYLYSQKRYSFSASALALMSLTRPDGLILTMVIGLDYIIRRRQVPWKPISVFIAIMMPWVTFATIYFGSPLPQSMVAKAIGAAQIDPWLSLHFFGANFIQGSMIPLSILFVVGVASNLKNPLRLAAVWFVAYAVLFIGANQFSNPVFDWYYAPLLLAFCVLAGAGANFILRPLVRAVPRPIGYAAITALCITFFITSADSITQKKHEVVSWIESREDGYRKIAQQLNRTATTENTLAAREIGVLGYYFKGRILDLDGLVSPQNVNRSTAEVILSDQPAFIAGIGSHIPWDFITSPWFVENYMIRDMWQIIDGRNMLFWQRRPTDLVRNWRSVDATTDGITLKSYALEPQRPEAGETIRLVIHWQIQGDAPDTYIAFTDIVSPDKQVLSHERSLLPRHEGATGWPASGVIIEQIVIKLPPEASQGVYTLIMGLYRWVSGEMERAEWTNSQGQPLGSELHFKGPVVGR